MDEGTAKVLQALKETCLTLRDAAIILDSDIKKQEVSNNTIARMLILMSDHLAVMSAIEIKLLAKLD